MLCTLLAAMVPPAVAQTAALPDELPPAFALDGDLSEWTRPPDVVLGAAQQLSGDPVRGPEDFSARVWWAMRLDGLVVAADVRDDAVLLPTPGADPLLADHLSIWIALPGATMPPIGFASERGTLIVNSPSDCVSSQDVAGCKTWLSAQNPRRATLGRLFIRQYTLTPTAIVETWGNSCVPAPVEQPSAAQVFCRMSQIALKRDEGGYHLEARVALTEFPATNQNPLSRVGLLVDAVDNDRGHDGQERTFSSSARADPNRPDTLPRYDLRRPPLFDSNPPLFAAVTLHDPTPGLFFFPATRLVAAYVFENLVLGGQRTPVLPSPAITALDWSQPRRLGSVGHLAVYEVPEDSADCAGCAVGRRMVTLRDDRVVSVYELGAATVRGFALRGELLYVVVAESGPSDPLLPDSPREHEITAMTIDEHGEFQTIADDDIVEGEPQDGLIYQSVTVQVTPDGSAFGFVGKRAHEESPGELQPFSRLTELNTTSGVYVPGKDQL